MKIYEVWKLGRLFLSMSFGLILTYIAIRYEMYLLGIMSVFISWQGGWSVKLTLEHKRLEDEHQIKY